MPNGKQHTAQQLFRYVSAGGAAWLIDYGTYSLLIWLQPGSHIGASIIGRVIGALATFAMHKFWTFEDHAVQGTARQAASYAALLIANLALSSALLFLAVDVSGWSPQISRLLIDVFQIGLSFVISRQIFRATGGNQHKAH